jgi:hypothetical protein
MGLDDLDRRMAQLDDQLDGARKYADDTSNWLPDPGTYQGILNDVDFFEQKKAPEGKAWLKLTWELQHTGSHDAEYAGLTVSKLYDLEPHLVAGPIPASTEEVQRKIGFMLKDLKTLGVKTDDPDFSLALIRPGSPIWDGCLGAPYELAVVESKKINERTGKPYVNLYLNERLGGPLTPDVPSNVSPDDFAPPVQAGSAVPDDDIPFAPSVI